MKPSWIFGVLVFLGVWGARGLSADPWLQSQDNLVPSTLEARLDPRVEKLLFLTPVAFLKSESLEITQPDGKPVRLTVTHVRSGSPDKTLWEFRFDVGKPYSAGCWILFRDGYDRLREIRIILQGEPEPGDNRMVHTGTWVRLTPVPGKAASRIDLFVAGRLAWGGWELPHALDAFPKMPARSIWKSCASQVDWTSLVPQRTPEDAKVEALAASIGRALGRVPASTWGVWVPDPLADARGEDSTGAAYGQWRSLRGEADPAGLGPWGVAAWLGGALCRHWQIPMPDTEALMTPRSHLTGYSPALDPTNLAQDPSLSLDWIRNIGLALNQGLDPDRKLSNDGADVKDLPFFEEIPPYGYSVDDLPAILTLLTSLHPGHLYLAGLNVQNLASGQASSIHFLPPAILLPWVGKDQTVHLVIFEGTKKIPWEKWAGPLGWGPGKRPNHVLLISLPVPETLKLLALPSS
jgi:hypothetical protein